MIFQYTIVSFLSTLLIAVLLVFLMIGQVQDQLILSRGDFYKEYFAAIPVNYSELLPDFSGEERDEEQSLPDHHLEEIELENHDDNWLHFESDLSQYPFINNVKIWNDQRNLVWSSSLHGFPIATQQAIPEFNSVNRSIRYSILETKPELVIVYSIPIIHRDDIIGQAELRIVDNSLKKNIDESRSHFTILIFSGGFIFYFSLFLLFYKVYRNQKKAISRLDKSQTLTIRTMSLLAELKDNDTGEHVQRTSEYCRILAESLRKNSVYRKYITDVYINDLERSAPLHDIGKVGIPESILLKPGKLSEDEFEIIKKHTVLGAQVLLSATESLEFRSFFEIGYQIVLHHHENWNGSGYPHGLKGSEIPLSARIMSIADVYDALTTKRPYKRAFSHEEAMKIILKEKDIKFDPKLIDSFLSIESKFRQISERKT